mgnify:CR=1 FL=1|tara:strand:+ start:160 stop:534 length:375 start_codon:yes stop_codon:yes gene_type:complete
MGNILGRFIIIGFFSTFINYLTFNISYTISGNIILSSYLGYFIGLINSFVFGKKWVFNIQNKISFFKKFLYFIIYFIGGTIMTFIISKLQFIGMNYKLAWFIGLNFSVANNFLCSKYFIFNKDN